jgi:hypothetical protein
LTSPAVEFTRRMTRSESLLTTRIEYDPGFRLAPGMSEGLSKMKLDAWDAGIARSVSGITKKITE